MTSRPPVRAARRRHTIRRSVAVALLLVAASACGRGEKRESAMPPATSDASPVRADAGSSTDQTSVPSAATLVGKLIDEVVSDTALQASWALEPLERHIGIVHANIGATHYLLADSLVGYDGPKALWRIRQAQQVTPPRAGEAWVTSCVLAGTDRRDGTIVARVTLTPDDTLPTPHDAWQLDPVAWRFSPYPAATLSCFNEGGGP